MQTGHKVVNPWPMVLVNLTVAIALVNYFWLVLNQRPPLDDEAFHLLSALKYFRILENPFPNMIGRLLTVDILYPPLFPLLAAWGARVLGVFGIVPFCMANVFFLAVTFFSLYGIGEKMGDRRSGVLASCFLALYPMIFHLSRMFMLEIALVGMVTLTMLLLLYSQGFSRTFWSLLAGISLGLGLLTKQMYVVFVAGPVFYFLAGSWRNLNGKQKMKRLINFFVFVAVGVAIAFPWYFADWKNKYFGMRSAFLINDSMNFDFSVASLETLVFYLKTLVDDQMGWIFFGALGFSILAKTKRLFALPFLFVWFMVPYAVFMLFSKKFYYYTLACLPAAALITAYGLLSIKNTVARRVVIFVLLFLGAEQGLTLSFLSPQIYSKILYFSRYSPIGRNYHAQTLLRRITEESGVESPVIATPDIDPNNSSEKGTMRLGENYVLINWETLKYMAAAASKSWTIKRIPGPDGKDFATKPDFVVCYGSLETMGFPAPLSSLYRLTDIFVMPDLSRVFLYKLEDFPVARGKEPVIHRDERNIVLENDFLQLELKDNSWRVLWENRALIKRLSVITAFKPFRIWNDSRQSIWRIVSVDKNRLRAKGYSSFFFPMQEWEFVLDGNRLYWTVKVLDLFFMKSEWEEINVWVTDVYRRWVTSRGAGDFPPVSGKDHRELVQPVANGGPFDSGYVGVEQSNDILPAVTFYSLRSYLGLKGQVMNTEGHLQGRILRYVFRWPWRYDYFRGCLVIGEKSFKSRRQLDWERE